MADAETVRNGTINDSDNNGNDEYLTPLLGDSSSGFQRAGVIRPGIMGIKKAASDADKTKYRELIANGATFYEIDEALGRFEDGSKKIVSQNVDYFTIRKRDCADPENVKRIMEKYADQDGKLRSIPVWFPNNDWWDVIPHSLRCYGSTKGLKHRSAFNIIRDEYSRVTDYKLVCETPEVGDPGKRIFGGRPWVQSDCVPADCILYQKKECKLGGYIEFLIPGIPGIDPWIIPTTSWYSLAAIKKALRRVYKATGGRISNLTYDGKSIFVLRKVMGKVSTIDAEGQPKLRSQFLINLDLTVDFFEVLKKYEEKPVLERGRAAVGVLSPSRNEVIDITESINQKGDRQQAEQQPAQEKQVESEPDEKSVGKAKDEVRESQKNAIINLAKICGVPDKLVTKELEENIKSEEDASKLIAELNKRDISRFIPND